MEIAREAFLYVQKAVTIVRYTLRLWTTPNAKQPTKLNWICNHLKHKGQMNYLEIVLQGYFNENNREFLEKYFFREFKKAEKEQYFEADEFFNGCIKVIESWEKYLQEQVFKRKHELYLMLDGAKNGTMKYGDLQGKTIEEKRRETIKYCEQELKEVRPDGIGSFSFTVHLHSLTNGRIAYNMSYNELLVIKIAILKAFKKTQPNIEPLPPQPIEEQKP